MRNTKTTGKRTTYTCPSCGLNTWGKSRIVLLCGACQVERVTLKETMDVAA